MVFWISWWTTEALGDFELHSPWWVTGLAGDDAESICAAVRAPTEADAKQLILQSYDQPPNDLEWRFCDQKPTDWVPFSERFPQDGWMVW